jgi:hypothetical protein
LKTLATLRPLSSGADRALKADGALNTNWALDPEPLETQGSLSAQYALKTHGALKAGGPLQAVAALETLRPELPSLTSGARRALATLVALKAERALDTGAARALMSRRVWRGGRFFDR